MSLKQSYLAIGLFVLFIFFVFSVNFLMTISKRDLRQIHIGTVEISTGIADSASEREMGLSGRRSLPREEGLLFIFEQPDIHAFWMKDMLFPIDILWFNSDKKLIYITESAEPSSYPDTFSANQPTLYVLEVSAGFVREKNIKIGDLLSF